MARSSEDIIASNKVSAETKAALDANNGIDPALTRQYGITDPDLVKYFSMAAMPTNMRFLDPSAGGSRSQEQLAARTANEFAKLGGQAELDRITNKVQSDPTLKSQLAAVTAAGNKGDFFSKIGDTVVRLTPTALKIAAVAAGADIAMGGALIGAGAGGAGAAGAGTTVGMTSAELAAADPYLASIAGQGGVTGAMEAAGAAGASGAPGVAAGSAAGNAATGLGYDTIGTAATGGGLSSLASPEVMQALAQNGITQDVLQQAATNPIIMEQITARTGMSPNTLSSLASGAASLFGASQAAGSAQDAYALQKQASDAALAEQKRQFDLGQAAQMPWRTAGETALTEQTNLMGLGPQGAEGQLASMMKSPGYEFRLGEGQKTVERGAAARGGLFSGAAGKALTKYGQDFATGEYGNRLSQLSSLSGQGQAAASGMAGYGANYAANTGNLLTNLGNAGAASSITQGTARQSGILGAGQALSSLFNPPKPQQTLADLFAANSRMYAA